MTLRPLPLPPPPERGSPPERSRRRPVFHRCASFSSLFWAARSPFLSSYPLPLPPGWRPNPVLSVVVTHGERDVDRAQHGENEGLHHADECPEGVERDRDPDLREAGEDRHHLVVRHHVGEQPDAERHGPER